MARQIAPESGGWMEDFVLHAEWRWVSRFVNIFLCRALNHIFCSSSSLSICRQPSTDFQWRQLKMCDDLMLFASPDVSRCVLRKEDKSFGWKLPPATWYYRKPLDVPFFTGAKPRKYFTGEATGFIKELVVSFSSERWKCFAIEWASWIETIMASIR